MVSAGVWVNCKDVLKSASACRRASGVTELPFEDSCHGLRRVVRFGCEEEIFRKPTLV